MFLPAELCLSLCPALWFEQPPNPAWSAVVKGKMSEKPQSLFSGSNIFPSQNLSPREAGGSDQVLDLPGEIQLITILWHPTNLAFSYLRSFPAQCHALFRPCGTMNEVEWPHLWSTYELCLAQSYGGEHRVWMNTWDRDCQVAATPWRRPRAGMFNTIVVSSKWPEMIAKYKHYPRSQWKHL